MSDELKCGCGGDALVFSAGKHYGNYRTASFYEVACKKCFIKTAGDYETKEQAIEAFRRATRVDVGIEYKEICRKLRIECVNRKLGLGGERLEDLLIKHIEKLEDVIKKDEDLFADIAGILANSTSQMVDFLQGKKHIVKDDTNGTDNRSKES